MWFVFFFLRICFSGYFWPKCLGIWVRLARHSLELLSLITWRSSRPAEHKLCSAFRNSGMSNRNLFMNLHFGPFSLNLLVFKTITVSQNSWWQLQNKIKSVWGLWNTKFGLKKTASPLHIKMTHIMADESEQKKPLKPILGWFVLSPDQVQFAQRPPPCWPQTRRHWLASYYRPSLTLFNLPETVHPQE